ncbi:MAG: ArsA family ATPase [Desulfobacteraceae bacterium]
MGSATNIFFMGKGGVGKSTSAALASVYLAQQGFKVLVASLDPAHNQSDIFQRDLSDKPIQLEPNLLALEIDQDSWIRRYLKGVHDQINRTYAYLTALNLDKYFSVIKHSPGLEEYALILAFKDICKDFAKNDFLIFDMPPTALSLKFFSLPTLSLIWIEHLLELRQEIIKKRDLITKIKLMKTEIERDKVLKKIKDLKGDYEILKDTFENREQTQINLVLNPDKLSFAESIRILNSLNSINISLNLIIYNKMQPDSSCAEIDEVFENIPMLNFPYSETPLIGIDTLQKFLKANDDLVGQQLNVCTAPV